MPQAPGPAADRDAPELSGGRGLVESAEYQDGGWVLEAAQRSRARHLAVLCLYAEEAHRWRPALGLRALLRWLSKDPPRRARARALAEAALAARERVDALLGATATDWSVERMGAVERAVLRVAAAEMLVLRDVPAGPAIESAVELARRYGDEASPGFVNGVLSGFARQPEVAGALALGNSGERPVDLHVHTNASDGELSPEETVAEAARAGLAALAVADHDNVAGIEPAAAEGRARGVEVVPAVELTCYHGAAELHMLGFFVSTDSPGLLQWLAHFREERCKRAEEICRRLGLLGAPVEYERVLAIAGRGSPGRPHIAKALVEAGHCRGIPEAFRRYLGQEQAAWVPKALIDPPAAMKLIHEAGGLAFLAHPGATGKDELIPELVRAGLDGLEVRHGLHSAPVARHYLQWAHRRDLLASGGSDFHGGLKADARIGQPFVPETWLIEMRDRWELSRAER